MSFQKALVLQGLELWGIIYAINASLIVLSHFSKSRLFRQTIPIAVSSSFIVLPFIVLHPDDYAARGGVVMAAGFYALKIYETVTEARFANESVFFKVAGVLATFADVQERTPSKPWVMPRLKSLATLVFFTLIHVAMLQTTKEAFFRRSLLASQLEVALMGALTHRMLSVTIGCISACLFAFYALHVYGDALAIVWRLIGYDFPLLMNSPHLSLSVRDFWLRWDTAIQKLLKKFVFNTLEPVIGSYAAAGLTFGASGAVHILPIIVSHPSDWLAASSMMAYFIVQFSVIVLERPFGVKSWNPWVARLWTILNLFGPSYLLVMPCLRIARTDF